MVSAVKRLQFWSITRNLSHASASRYHLLKRRPFSSPGKLERPFRSTVEKGRRRAGIFLVALALIFTATGAVHCHKDTLGSEHTCPICHLAHAPLLLQPPTGLLTRFTVVLAAVLPLEDGQYHFFCSSEKLSRAPPAA
jgi:hypothetical protein